MGWATEYIESLKRGETVTFRPRGRSMEPLVSDGAIVRVAPVQEHEYRVGDIVLCRVSGAEYLHLINRIEEVDHLDDGGVRFLIGNNRGRVNGWTRMVFGRCVSVDGVVRPGGEP